MAQFDRKAGVLWTGDLRSGKGLVSTESQTLFELPFSYPTRFEDEVGLNPEELLAAAHASCFSMSVVSTLEKNGFTPVQTEITATCTLASKDEGGHEISRMRLHVRCEIPDIDEERFQELVKMADSTCPFSNLLRTGLDIEITAALISPAGSEGEGKGEARPIDA
jgi:osmotically inducible protein OsmC